MNPRNILNLTWSRKLLLATAALVAALVPFLAGIARAQSSSFQAVTIRSADESVGTKSSFGNGKFAMSGRGLVDNLITQAFGLPTCMAALEHAECPYVAGGPPWIRTDFYDLQATLPEGTPSYSPIDYIEGEATALYPMIQALLRDRFQLRFHHEMREVPLYILSVAGSGHKMKPAADAGKLLPDPFGKPRPRSVFSFKQQPNGAGGVHLTVANTPVKMLAYRLAQMTSLPVLDRTKLEGNFDFAMDFEPNLVAKPKTTADYMTPAFFSAMEEQTGLRIAAAREKIDVIVIDNIQRPTEN